MASKMCPRCGAVFPERVWKVSKTNVGVSVICRDCDSKFHPKKLKKPNKLEDDK